MVLSRCQAAIRGIAPRGWARGNREGGMRGGLEVVWFVIIVAHFVLKRNSDFVGHLICIYV